MVEAFASVADHAARRSVTVCMETHDSWCDPKHVAEVMRRVNRPAIAVNWDIMHPVRAGNATIEESFQTLRPWIRHLHVHDGESTADGLKLVPIGTGVVDHRRAIELLASVGYDGFISGEWIGWEPYETHLPRELATMKRFERELA
jgi:sugar phosphate isomerase/epimerase